MKTITLLAAMAGMIICATGPASAQNIYLDFGNNPGPRYRDYDGPRYRDYDGPRYRDRQRYGSAGSADTTRPRAGLRPLTDVRTGGPCKTVFANRIEATEQLTPCPGCGAARSACGAVRR